MGDRLAAYIDGFNLYHGLHQKYQRRYLWLDVVQLVQNLRPNSELVKVKYFTSDVLDQPDALSRQAQYLRALDSMHHKDLEVIKGRYQSKPHECRECGHIYTHYEEKETDVNIAIHLVADVSAHIADTYLIISADSDLAPAVKMSRNIDPSLVYVAAFPPKRNSHELSNLADAHFMIGHGRITGSQLPNPVVTHKGRFIPKPERWA